MLTIKPSLTALILGLGLLVSACAGQDGTRISSPPLADLKAATEAKPLPTPDTVTDSEADARYNASVENWGDRVSSAGVRLCLWFQEVGVSSIECTPWLGQNNKGERGESEGSEQT